MADSVLPRFDMEDERKRRYLSFRLCGFDRTESCKYAGIMLKTVYHWRRSDTAFEELEKTNLLEVRNKFSKEIVKLDFTRNFKLALERDFQVLSQAVQDATKLTRDEVIYLSKIRALYTPQQFQVLEGVLSEMGQQTWDEMIRGVQAAAQKTLQMGAALTLTERSVSIDASYSSPALSPPQEYAEGTVVEDRPSEARESEEEEVALEDGVT